MIVAPTPTHEKILTAAERCFRRTSVHGTTVGDVAEEAELSRKTVYRLFGDRQGLIAGVLRVQFRDTIEAMREEVSRYPSISTAIVEGPVFAIRRLRAEPVFRELILEEQSRGVNMVLTIDDDVRDLTRSVWIPFFARARSEGRIVSERTDIQLIDGLISMVSMLVLRSDLSEEEIRQYLRDFLVPAIVTRSGLL